MDCKQQADDREWEQRVGICTERLERHRIQLTKRIDRMIEIFRACRPIRAKERPELTSPPPLTLLAPEAAIPVRVVTDDATAAHYLVLDKETNGNWSQVYPASGQYQIPAGDFVKDGNDWVAEFSWAAMITTALSSYKVRIWKGSTEYTAVNFGTTGI